MPSGHNRETEVKDVLPHPRNFQAVTETSVEREILVEGITYTEAELYILRETSTDKYLGEAEEILLLRQFTKQSKTSCIHKLFGCCCSSPAPSPYSYDFVRVIICAKIPFEVVSTKTAAFRDTDDKNEAKGYIPKEHSLILLSIYNSLVLAESATLLGKQINPTCPPPPSKTDKTILPPPPAHLKLHYKYWKVLGFQGINPGNDLRSTGMLSLLQMLWICEHPCVESRNTFHELATLLFKASQNPNHEFPLMLVSIKCTAISLKTLQNGHLNSICRETGSVFTSIHTLYAALMHLMIVIWLSELSDGIMKLRGRILNYSQIEAFLVKAAQQPNSLIQYFKVKWIQNHSISYDASDVYLMRINQ